MEKIYMNDNKNNKQSFFKKFFNDKGSMLALVVIAVVGIFGLVAFGFNQISFAADDESVAGLGESFTSGQYEVRTIGQAAEGQAFPTQVFTTDSGDFVYCTEFDANYSAGATYRNNQTVDKYESDPGLIYLISNLKSSLDAQLTGEKYSELTLEKENRLRQWIIQTAIWSYLYQKEGTSGENVKFGQVIEQIGGKPVDIVKNTNYLYSAPPVGKEGITFDIYRTNSASIYEEFGVNQIISSAFNVGGAWISIEKKSNNISITKDNKYYQTDLISVLSGVSDATNVISFNNYSVDISKAPEGTKLVSEDGNVYDDITKMSPTSKFYVRIPVDKVKDENKNFDIVVTGYFKAYGGEQYTAEGSQTVIDLKTIDNVIQKPLNIDINYTPKVEDTGMSTAQTIYFIGLIILLSGVGIIYANSKPQGSN